MFNLIASKIHKEHTFAENQEKNGRHHTKAARRRDFILENYEIPTAIKLLKIPQKLRILQIGCGKGFALTALSCLCKPARLVGIDINEKLLKRAKRRLKVREIYAELFQEDVRRMPFPDASFDVVVDLGLCNQISQNDLALLEISRILITGGIFVHETSLKHFLSHPLNSMHHKIPWHATPCLKSHRSAIFWASRIKCDLSSNGFNHDKLNIKRQTGKKPFLNPH